MHSMVVMRLQQAPAVTGCSCNRLQLAQLLGGRGRLAHLRVPERDALHQPLDRRIGIAGACPRAQHNERRLDQILAPRPLPGGLAFATTDHSARASERGMKANEANGASKECCAPHRPLAGQG
jgi:hypothetical protein